MTENISAESPDFGNLPRMQEANQALGTEAGIKETIAKMGTPSPSFGERLGGALSKLFHRNPEVSQPQQSLEPVRQE